MDVMNPILLTLTMTMHSTMSLFCSPDSFGIVIVIVVVVVGLHLVILPLMHEMSFPCVFSAVLMSSNVIGQFLIQSLSMTNLKFLMVGALMM